MSTRFLRAAATLLFVASPTAMTFADAPPTSDPSFRLLSGFDAPGTFPTTVTSANINIQPFPGVSFDGAGEDLLKITFPSAGPIAWTSSRNNSGDTALSIGPFDPNDPLYYPPNDFVDNYQAANTNTANPIDTSSNDLSTLAWRVNYETGALLATTRHNGVDDGYTVSDFGSPEPVGTIYGVSYFNVGFGQGWGFRMNDGVFANGGSASSDLQTGAVGAAGGRHEASFNVATAYFPYEQGWVGAWVNGAANGAATFAASADSIHASTVSWNSGIATVQLPGVDSAGDGMLFVAASNSSSTTRLTSAFADGSGGWTTTIRLDEDADTTGQTNLDSGNDFQFLYIPYDAQNLIGGNINGDTGASINAAGDGFFDLTRTGTGRYALSIFEDDGQTKKAEDDGTLLLSVADTLGASSTIGSRSFLSYEYDSVSGDFIIEARELISTTSATPDDVFGNEFSMVDTDFYFAWADFANPLAPLAALLGDTNNDGVVDTLDIDPFVLLLTDPAAYATAFPDVDPLAVGDINLDMVVDTLDIDPFVALLTSGSLASGGGAVPEPGSIVLVVALACGIGAATRRMNRC